MGVEEVIKFIQAVGFPIFVAVYVLVRMEKAMTTLSDSIKALTIALDHHEIINKGK